MLLNGLPYHRALRLAMIAVRKVDLPMLTGLLGTQLRLRMTHPGYPMPPLHLALCLCDLPMLYAETLRRAVPMLCFEPYRFAVPMPCLYSAKLNRAIACRYTSGPGSAIACRYIALLCDTFACLCTSGLDHAVALPTSQCTTMSCRSSRNIPPHRPAIAQNCFARLLPAVAYQGLTSLNFTVAHHSSVQSSYLYRGCSLQQITQPYRHSAMPTSAIPCRHNTLLILDMFCRCPAHLNHTLLCRGCTVLSIAVLRHCISSPIFNELRRSTRYAIRTERLTGQLSALVPQYPPYSRSERCSQRPS